MHAKVKWMIETLQRFDSVMSHGTHWTPSGKAAEWAELPDSAVFRSAMTNLRDQDKASSTNKKEIANDSTE